MATADERLGGLRLIGLRDAVVDTINALFPSGPVTAFKHRGEWTDESIAHYATKTPCISITYTAAKDWEITADGYTQGLIALTAFVITEEADGDEDDAALALTQLLLTLVPGNDWGVEGVAIAENVDGLNAYTHKLDGQGVTIHAVSWVHQVDFPKMSAEEYAAMPDFLHLFTRLDPTKGDAEVGDAGEFDPEEHMNEVREP